MKELNFQRACTIKNEILFLEHEMNVLDDARKRITSKVVQGQNAEDEAKHLVGLLIKETRGRPRYQQDCR